MSQPHLLPFSGAAVTYRSSKNIVVHVMPVRVKNCMFHAASTVNPVYIRPGTSENTTTTVRVKPDRIVTQKLPGI